MSHLFYLHKALFSETYSLGYGPIFFIKNIFFRTKSKEHNNNMFLNKSNR